jgi:RNA polymerase sigma factor (sigma-70 family)
MLYYEERNNCNLSKLGRSLTKKDIEILYEITFDKIYRFFYYKFLSKDIAQDLTSQTYLCFIEKIQKDNDIKEPKKYLFGIAKIIFFQHLKTKYTHDELSLDESVIGNFEEYADEFEEKFQGNDLRKIASEFISKLPEKQKEILSMRLVEDMSLSLICKLMDKDMNYIKTTQKRGIANLKKLLACTPPNT